MDRGRELLEHRPVLLRRHVAATLELRAEVQVDVRLVPRLEVPDAWQPDEAAAVADRHGAGEVPELDRVGTPRSRHEAARPGPLRPVGRTPGADDRLQATGNRH